MGGCATIEGKRERRRPGREEGRKVQADVAPRSQDYLPTNKEENKSGGDITLESEGGRKLGTKGPTAYFNLGART